MQYEDSITIATPEGVRLEVPLAGIGSRLSARLIDALIIGIPALIALVVYRNAMESSSLSAAVVAILGLLIGFGSFWAYDVSFEAFGGGRTPGKRALGIRVVGESGEPIGFSGAAVRNLMRLVDEYLTLWLCALISIVRSPRNQRVGDIASGAMVIRDRFAEAPAEATIGIDTLPDIAAASSWDTAAVSDADLAAARRFLQRRSAIDIRTRKRLAGQLQARLQPRVPGSEGVRSAEQFVELLVAVKSGRA